MYRDNYSDWQEALNRLSAIREQQDYSSANVDYIREQLQSDDERIRGGAALAAEGCLFEPYVLDLLADIVENDPNDAIRKAAIHALGNMIHEGVMQNFEDEAGADTDLEYFEEWDELQSGSLQEDYQRTKYLMYNILQNEFEDREVREAALAALSDLGFLTEVQEWISDFSSSDLISSQLVAVYAMGKYPQYWIQQIGAFLEPQNPKPLLMEAISSSYSSDSKVLSEKIEKLLEQDDPDILTYALMTLANINKLPNLPQKLQKFSLHADERVRKAARDAINTVTNKNFSDYMEDEVGFES